MNLIGQPIRCTESLAVAARIAKEREEPILFPVAVFADDRGWSMVNQFQSVLSPAGQVNYSVQYPGVIKAWHRHQKQTDFWLCIRGMIKVGIHRDCDNRAWMAIVGEMSSAVIVIPPMLWHGVATIGPDPAGLLYYVTEAYNPDAPDEERRAWDVTDFPWQQVHR